MSNIEQQETIDQHEMCTLLRDEAVRLFRPIAIYNSMQSVNHSVMYAYLLEVISERDNVAPDSPDSERAQAALTAVNCVNDLRILGRVFSVKVNGVQHVDSDKFYTEVEVNCVDTPRRFIERIEDKDFKEFYANAFCSAMAKPIDPYNGVNDVLPYGLFDDKTFVFPVTHHASGSMRYIRSYFINPQINAADNSLNIRFGLGFVDDGNLNFLTR